MKAVVQRAHAGFVEVAGQRVGEIDKGLVVFLGCERGDGEADEAWMTRKLAALRVFTDEAGKMSRSVLEVEGSMLLVSQFTLLGDVRRGNRPSFTDALGPDEAEPMVERVADALRSAGVPLATGRFGADMRVLVDNDGPVTILLDSRRR